MRQTHYLKTWPDAFAAVERGDKTFEWRRDDRGYVKGDVVVLQEWSPAPGEGYSGRTLSANVGFVLRAPRFGVPEGYCAFSLINCSPTMVTISYFKQDSGKWYCNDENVEWPRDPDHYTGWAPFEKLHRIPEMFAVCMVTPLGFPQFSPPRAPREVPHARKEVEAVPMAWRCAVCGAECAEEVRGYMDRCSRDGAHEWHRTRPAAEEQGDKTP